jgi:hypothetical protein
MKKMKLFNFLLITIGFLVYGCKPTIESDRIEQVQNFVEINGIKAILPKGYIKNDFIEPKIDDIFGNLTFSENSKNFRMTAKDERIEKLYAYIEKEKAKYPNLSIQPLRNNDIVRIKKDFPSLKNEIDILNASNEVFTYYNSFVRKAIKEAYKIDSARPSGIIDDFFQYQVYFGVLAGVNLLDIYLAAEEAGADTYSRYGTNRDYSNDDNANIYEHCLWNAYGVRYMIQTGRSKDGAIRLMCDVAVKWEAKNHASEDIMFSKLPAVMDLKNNLASRTYMDENVKWGIWILRKWPNQADIRNYFGPKCDVTNGYSTYSSAEGIINSLNSSNARSILKSAQYYANRTLVASAGVKHYPKL